MVFAADHMKNLKVLWKGPKLLQITYDEARILSFKNFWYHRDVQDFHYVVEIQLNPTSAGFSLPRGDREW